MKLLRSGTRFVALAPLLWSMAGCGDGITLSLPPPSTVSVEVTGIVTRGGEPFDSVSVRLFGHSGCFFIFGCGTASSDMVVTGADGRYTLTWEARENSCDPLTLLLTNLRNSSESVELPLGHCGNHTANYDFVMKTKLAFVSQPRTALAAAQFQVSVAVQDISGSNVTLGRDSVTLSLGANPGGGTLSGSLTVLTVGGIAHFEVQVDQPGSGYTLVASAGGLSEATSTSFAISRSIPLSFTSVSAGSGYSCGVTDEGAAYCWGYSTLGGLGNGTNGVSSTPEPVSGGLSFASVSAGGHDTTCGVTVDGAAYCWGENYHGQLGDGAHGIANRRSTPVPVLGGLSFASVSPGLSHTCGLGVDGSAYCWGSNGDGRLGDGGTGYLGLSPRPVAGGVNFTSVSAGYYHTCGVTVTGDAYCWGQNDSGQLGDGSTTDRLTPVLVAGGLSFNSVSAAIDHTCGVTATGDAYCWGQNDYGQLGDGSTAWSAPPVRVESSGSFGSVSAGKYHTCGVTATGDAYCWGQNDSGQLGHGSTTDRLAPVLVADGLTFGSISAGRASTCGLALGGMGYCWGANWSAQLGDGTTVNRLTPVPVKGVSEGG